MMGMVMNLVGMKDRDMGMVMWGKLMVVSMKDRDMRVAMHIGIHACGKGKERN